MSSNFQIFVQCPDLKIPTQSLTIQNPNPNPQSILKSLIPNLISQTGISPDSFYFTLNGKAISNHAQNPQIAPLSTFTLRLRLPGGGGDGGSTCAESRDCYLNMYATKKPDKVDPNEMRLSKWLNCSLSNEPLKRPIVIDKLGNLFNKEALLSGLLKKSLPGEFWYIKGLKDMIPVELEEVKGGKEGGVGKFQCPVSGLECNGKYKFYAIKTCGHVLSAKALKEVKSSSCLVCHTEFEESDKIVINGNEEEVKVLREKMEEEKAKLKENGKKSKKLKNGVVNGKHKIEENGGNDKDGSAKRFKAVDVAPAHANKEVYASIFTSSKKSDFKETYSCRSLPLGRN